MPGRFGRGPRVQGPHLLFRASGRPTFGPGRALPVQPLDAKRPRSSNPWTGTPRRRPSLGWTGGASFQSLDAARGVSTLKTCKDERIAPRQGCGKRTNPSDRTDWNIPADGMKRLCRPGRVLSFAWRRSPKSTCGKISAARSMEASSGGPVTADASAVRPENRAFGIARSPLQFNAFRAFSGSVWHQFSQFSPVFQCWPVVGRLLASLAAGSRHGRKYGCAGENNLEASVELPRQWSAGSPREFVACPARGDLRTLFAERAEFELAEFELKAARSCVSLEMAAEVCRPVARPPGERLAGRWEGPR